MMQLGALFLLALGGGIGLGSCWWGAAVPATWVVSLGVLISSGAIMHAAVGLFSLRYLTIPAVWWFAYVLVVFLPAHDVVLHFDGHHASTYLAVVQSALLTVPAGVVLVTLMTGYSLRTIRRHARAPILTDDSPFFLHVFCLALAISLVLTLRYFIEAPTIPLFYILWNPGEQSTAVELREEAWKLLGSPLLYWYDILRRIVYPFLISIALGYWLDTRKRVWLALFILASLAGVLLAGASTAKMPVMAMVLVVGLFLHLYRGGALRASRFLVVGGLVLTFPVGLMLLASPAGDLDVLTILRLLYVRVFYTPAELLFHYIEFFPGEVGYQYGKTIGKSSWITGQEYFNIEGYVYQRLFPTGLSSGAAPSPFLGNLNADFGIVGVVGGGILAGILMQGIQVWLARGKKTIVRLATCASLMWSFVLLNFQSLAVVLLSGGVVFVVIGSETIRVLPAWLRVMFHRTNGKATLRNV